VSDAIERVRLRVSQGGHGVAEAVMRRRFQAGLANFEQLYQPRVDRWQLIDNWGDQPVLLVDRSNC
jgi:predicted ABC-type ATPase